jgi:hypothetical protein
MTKDEVFKFQVSNKEGSKVLWLVFENGMINLNELAVSKSTIIQKALRRAIVNYLGGE